MSFFGIVQERRRSILPGIRVTATIYRPTVDGWALIRTRQTQKVFKNDILSGGIGPSYHKL